MIKAVIAAAFILSAYSSCDIRSKDKIAANDELQKQMEIKDPTTVEVIDTTFDFGKVTDGQTVNYNFRFKNSGNKPLVITNVAASCGCTVPEKPEAPIKPGEMGYIKVTFNSKGRVGSAHKTITVNSNAQPEFPELLLKGEVTAAANPE